jgi:hypothetical protein
VVDDASNEELVGTVRAEVLEMCDDFPLYEEFSTLA